MKTFLLVVAALLVPPLLYVPRAEALRSAEERVMGKVAEMDGRIAQDRSAVRKRPQFEEARVFIDQEMEKLLRILPDTIPPADEIRGRVESAAAISGVRMIGFEPYKPGIDHDYRYEWISIEADGSASGTAAFMSDLGRAEPILAVSNLQMRRSDAGWHSRFFVETFALQR